MDTKATRTTFSHNVALIWVGILIPILVALIPYIHRFAFPDIDLKYQFEGPIEVNENYAFAVTMENTGSKPQHNVKIWLPYESEPTGVNSLDKTRHFLFKASSPVSVADSKDKKFKVVSVDVLRPTEKVKISILMGGHGIYIHDYAIKGLKVSSDDAIASLDEADESLFFLYQYGAFMFVALMVIVGIYGIYYTYFMDSKKKEEMILKEIDKLK